MLRHYLKKVKYYPAIPNWDKPIYMPVSMNNRLLRNEDTLKEILDWIFKRSDTLNAIIGDYLHRNNVLLTVNSEDIAIAKAMQTGEEISKLLLNAMAHFQNKKLNIIPIKQFYERDDFEVRFEKFEHLYQSNSDFFREINYLTQTFLNRQSHVEVTDLTLLYCRNYLLEELVVFEMLADEGYFINIYPGKQLDVLKKIVTDKISYLPTNLNKLSLVEMRFKYK